MTKIYNKYIIAVQSMITGTIDVGFTLILQKIARNSLQKSVQLAVV